MGTGHLRNGNSMLGRVQRRLDMKHNKEVERVFNSNSQRLDDYNKELLRRENLMSQLKEGQSFDFEPLDEPILESFPKRKKSRYLLS